MLERYRSGQTGQTVNLLAYAFSGSNPLLSTILPIKISAGLLSGNGSAPHSSGNQDEGEHRLGPLSGAKAPKTECLVSPCLAVKAKTKKRFCVESHRKGSIPWWRGWFDLEVALDSFIRTGMLISSTVFCQTGRANQN